MEPIANAARNMFEREDAIRGMYCIRAPVGCGREIEQQEFMSWDVLTRKEYRQSGWCNRCQDRVFRDPYENEDDCTCNWEPCCSVDVGIGTITCGDQHRPACPVHDFPDPEYDPDMREDPPPVDIHVIDWTRLPSIVPLRGW